MSSAEPFPAVADVERFGNLLLSAWAPPSHMLLADAWIESMTGVLLGSSKDLFLLGHRPGRVASLSREALAEETRLLLGSLSEEPGCSSLHRIPQEVARASTALLRSGNLHVRQRRVDESTGQAHVDSTHVGRVLVLLSVDATVGAVESVAVSGASSSPPLLHDQPRRWPAAAGGKVASFGQKLDRRHRRNELVGNVSDISGRIGGVARAAIPSPELGAAAVKLTHPPL